MSEVFLFFCSKVGCLSPWRPENQLGAKGQSDTAATTGRGSEKRRLRRKFQTPKATTSMTLSPRRRSHSRRRSRGGRRRSLPSPLFSALELGLLFPGCLAAEFLPPVQWRPLSLGSRAVPARSTLPAANHGGHQEKKGEGILSRLDGSSAVALQTVSRGVFFGGRKGGRIPLAFDFY